MTPAGFETLRVEADGRIGRLVLDRPARLNALSPETLGELIDAAHWFDARSEVRVVIVRGEGRAFCAGFDLGGMRSRGDAAQPTEDHSRAHPHDPLDLGRRMADAVTDMRALTVAAIQGHCVGGGVVLAAACDLRVAACSARFSIPEVDLGLPLAWGGIPRLVRELGPAVTKELVLTCRPFDAREARALRFVNEVVDDSELDDAVDRVAAKLASQPAYALTQTKRQVNAVAEEIGSTEQSFRDAQTLRGALEDHESQQAMRRYLER